VVAVLSKLSEASFCVKVSGKKYEAKIDVRPTVWKFLWAPVVKKFLSLGTEVEKTTRAIALRSQSP
jgi:hypothetical protein